MIARVRKELGEEAARQLTQALRQADQLQIQGIAPADESKRKT